MVRKLKPSPPSRALLALLVFPLLAALHTIPTARLTAHPPAATCRYSHYASFPPPSVRVPPSAQPSKLHYTKVPKTGSTTVAALLRRYCMRRGLRAVAPRSGREKVSWRERRDARDADGGIVDATLAHMRYNVTGVEELLLGKGRAAGAEKVFRVVSVREPVERFLSGYFFGRLIWERSAQEQQPPGQFCCPELTGDVEKWVTECTVPGLQVNYAAPIDWDDTRRQNVRELLAHYDHDMVTEDMVRSIMTLAPKVGLTLSEMLVVSQKYGKRQAVETGLEETERIRSLVQDKVNSDSMTTEREFYRLARERLEEEWAALPEDFRAAEDDLRIMTQVVSKDRVCPYHSRDGDVLDDCVNEWVRRSVYCEKDPELDEPAEADAGR